LTITDALLEEGLDILDACMHEIFA
jgi:hypothetical protein